MTLRKQQKSLLELENSANYDKTVLVMQAMYRPYKRASVLRASSSHKLTQSTSTMDVQPSLESFSPSLTVYD
jgi:hypothetical protein